MAKLAHWFGVAAVAVLATACKTPQPAWMQDGMPAPHLSGLTVDGQPVDLAEHRGRVVAVVFFADWCPHCRELYETERELGERMGRGNFTLIGVDADNTPEEIRSAVRREHVTWPVVYDGDGHNSAAWGVTVLPTVYVLDANGIIRGYSLSDSSVVETVDALIKDAHGTH